MIATNLDMAKNLLRDDFPLLKKMHAYITDTARLTESGASTLEEFKQRVKALPLPCLQALVSGAVSFKEAELAAQRYESLNDIERAVLEELAPEKGIKILLAPNPAQALAAVRLQDLTAEVKELSQSERKAPEKQSESKL